MPLINGKQYPYTPAGKALAAKKAIADQVMERSGERRQRVLNMAMSLSKKANR